jgi:hypothetical protein
VKKRKRSRKKSPPANRRKTGETPDLVEAGKNTRFKPGQSGNPQGRPRTKIFRDIAREIVEMVDTKRKKDRARILIDTLFKHAEKGSLGHFKEIHRLLEEDSTDRRIEVTKDPNPQPGPNQDTSKVLMAIRLFYGLSEPTKEELRRGENALEQVREHVLNAPASTAEGPQ